MTEKELIKRIDRITAQHIFEMSDNSLKMLTSDFKESLVRRLVSKGPSFGDQKKILDCIDDTIYRTRFFDGYEVIEKIRFDLECGILITVSKESDGIEKKISDAEIKITAEKNTEKIAALEARIKELEAENERLSKENEELKEIKMIMDTPLDAIEADSKVGLTEILKLMVKDGANFEKSNNKTIGAKALKMMTGRSESACKQIFSSPLSPTYPQHKKKIAELNDYLKTLGMKTLL